MPSSPRERRFFLCTGQSVQYKDLYKYADSHIIGELRYLTDEGRRVTALALYETPVSAAQVPPTMPNIIVHIIGDARLIKCRHAGCTRSQRWEIGRAGFLSLMDRMRYQDKALEMEQEEKRTSSPSKLMADELGKKLPNNLGEDVSEVFCANCGHSKSRHQTAGGFCKHCPCNEFKGV